MTDHERLLENAKNGNINAFHALFRTFQPQLKSYLYRLLVDRNDTEDILHDTFVKAFDKIGTFKGNASLKSWVFRIGTNLSYDFLKSRKRWSDDAQDRAKELAGKSLTIRKTFDQIHERSSYGHYDIREHIDFCFTCISKTLPIKQQVALILKDVYGFSRAEIGEIIESSEGVVKHLLHDSRTSMTEIFNHRCALINKRGTCHQCTELAGVYNPKQAKQEYLMKIEMIEKAPDAQAEELYKLRAALVAHIDPLRSSGADLQDAIMQCTRQAVGEIERMEKL